MRMRRKVSILLIAKNIEGESNCLGAQCETVAFGKISNNNKIIFIGFAI